MRKGVVPDEPAVHWYYRRLSLPFIGYHFYK